MKLRYACLHVVGRSTPGQRAGREAVHVPRNEERRPAANGAARKQAGRPGESVTDWAVVYADAERWVSWSARRRWPAFPCNDALWAASVTDWELNGRRAAA